MKKQILFCVLSFSYAAVCAKPWQPVITKGEYTIAPRIDETCYQYAERKVQEMIAKYPNRRIIGSIWLSEYWAHHYYGAIEFRNYTWKAVTGYVPESEAKKSFRHRWSARRRYICC